MTAAVDATEREHEPKLLLRSEHDLALRTTDADQSAAMGINCKSLAGKRDGLCVDKFEDGPFSREPEPEHHGVIVAGDEEMVVEPQAAGKAEVAQFLEDRFGIGVAGLFLPLVVHFDEKCFSLVLPIAGEVAPPVIIVPHDPGQAAAVVAETVIRGELHRLQVERLDLTLFGQLGVVRVGTQQLTLPEEPAVEVLSVAGAHGESLSSAAVVFGDGRTGDGVRELVISRGRLMGFRSRDDSRCRPVLRSFVCADTTAD